MREVALAALYLGAGLARHLNRKGLLEDHEMRTLVSDIEQITAQNPQGPAVVDLIKRLFPVAR